MRFLVRLIINALALGAVAYFVPGVRITGIEGAIVGALVLGVVNAILRPILILLALPLEIITLGLFTFVINALLFWVVGHLGLGLIVSGFGSALVGSIVLAIVSWLLSLVFAPAPRRSARRW
ncbi:MAG: phage holin family protein [Candidatus Eremiobacteraeota bacterium]|nr:phage holin family protein [Candidatus Eremiobacteraeota bacterium]MBC5802698.1 phage holin family protein [Candidatus Eremiobacteraeota bacterium]MBC5821011.1 phage holin family protein [Candidatus Eremiobacteraeota bacterium]